MQLQKPSKQAQNAKLYSDLLQAQKLYSDLQQAQKEGTFDSIPEEMVRGKIRDCHPKESCSTVQVAGYN